MLRRPVELEPGHSSEFCGYRTAETRRLWITSERDTMAEKKPQLDEMVEKLQRGEIPPGSKEGMEVIRQMAKANPSDVAKKLYLLPNETLQKGMKAAGMSDDDIEDVLRVDGMEPENPFSKATELTPDRDLLAEEEPESSPFEYDPSAEMENGPRRR